MMFTGGVDVGSTYTKAVILREDGRIAAKTMVATGFRLAEAATCAFEDAIAAAGTSEHEIAYVVSTGLGRYQVPFRDTQVTELTANARGARHFFPSTRTLLDLGAQTMKSSRLDERGKVKAFRLTDKCAAGTGAFLETTARYLGYEIDEIGPLTATSKEPVAIFAACAVFAESEVINHVSSGRAPADIMHGAIVSLADRSVQLMKRTGIEPEITLVGGIMRFETMVRVMSEELKTAVNVPPEDLAQYTGAIGAALLAQRRLEKRCGEAGMDGSSRATGSGSAAGFSR
jgi:(R)-2-hydroxyacyl-CoA dehydratese activating ATPase